MLRALRLANGALRRHSRRTRLFTLAERSAHDAHVPKPALQLTPAVYEYLVNNTREHAVLRACREATLGRSAAQMQIPPEQGALLSMLIELIGAKKVLELGTFTARSARQANLTALLRAVQGYSSTAMALALPPDGELVTCDRDREIMAVAAQFWEQAHVTNKIRPLLAPGLESLDSLLPSEEGSFDLAFIDADKRGYPAYYERCLRLVRVGGLIAVDNTLWYGRVADPSDESAQTVSMRDFNARVLADERVSHAMVPIADGLTLLRRKR